MVKQLVDSGEIGEVTKIHATARAPGSASSARTSWITCCGSTAAAKVKWVVGQAIGTGMLTDSHPSADYVIGEHGVRERRRAASSNAAPTPQHFVPGDNPLRDIKFWTDSALTIHGTHGYARVTTGNGWQAVTKIEPRARC